MANHPELELEQAYIDNAYLCLERARAVAEAMREGVVDGQGGTYQNRYERDVVWERVGVRLHQLELGERSLIFGRVDTEPTEEDPEGESFHIGRIAVSDDKSNSIVVDWRAPLAETFYRATGLDPMGLRRRRHFASRGQTLLGIDDELFGSATAALDQGQVQGHGALIAALEESRSGKLSDIVGTIQTEQDRIIRSPLQGVLVVQGGPGTGKTVVALHRAAYLLYSQRFPLEGQGVLVLGPNRVFLSYIEQVLPSLGEAGIQIAVLADLVPAIRSSGHDLTEVGRVKGDSRMINVIRRAVRDRQHPLRESLRVPYGLQFLVLTPEDSVEIIEQARRRSRTHNAGRRHVEQLVFERLASTSRSEETLEAIRERIRRDPAVIEALERMWPVLTPAELLNDLFGSRGLLRSAGSGRLKDSEWPLLFRERSHVPNEVVFPADDVPLLDEALELLGPRPKHLEADAVRTFGHIVVDEAQDLSPMELRMLDRRSLNGSMTIVGDIAQATGAWPHESWESVLEYLPDRRPPRRADLTIGYRVPGPIMELAAKMLVLAAPGIAPPQSIRHTGEPPLILGVASSELEAEVVERVRYELKTIGSGNIGVIVPESMAEQIDAALTRAGIDYGRATRQGLEKQVTVVPVNLVKGLELDSVLVVEPKRVLNEQIRGAQSLYVALTRSTKRLTVIHTGQLPEVLLD
ncbi:DNA/RNA helicase, superfamily I [Actinobacteria bacterium IMCC26207]|nr:DNA/RNA helicase, superfamily I [Actinobacteria bacterium IMCC26207]